MRESALSPTPLLPTRQQFPQIALVGSSSNFSETLMRAMGHHLPDVTLIHYPSMEEFVALPAAKTQWLQLLLIDDSTFTNASDALRRGMNYAPSTVIALAFIDYHRAAAVYGAPCQTPAIHSFIPLDVRLDVWLALVRLVLHGGRYIPEELLARRHDPRSPDRGHDEGETLGLTQRQYKVLKLVAEGLPNKVIATRLGVSDHTVKLHIHNIITKMGVTNRTEAAARFYDGSP